jgi:hypothetical protein
LPEVFAMPPTPRPPQSRRQGTTRREALQVGSLSLLGLSLSATHASAAPNTGQKLYLEAYTDRSSYQPGDEVCIHVSTNASRYALEFARLGASREVAWSKENLPGAEYPVPDDASARGCNWPVALTLKVPLAWKSGYYCGLAKLSVCPSNRTCGGIQVRPRWATT